MEGKIDEIEQTNRMQDQRLGVMEFRELASSAYEREDYARSLELWNKVIEAQPEDVDALILQPLNLFKLGRFVEAVDVLESVLQVNPDDIGAAFNYLEGLFLAKKFDLFENAVETYKHEFSKEEYVNWYFQALLLYKNNDEEHLSNHVKALLAEPPSSDEPETYISWDFDGFRKGTRSDHGSGVRTLLLIGLDVLAGERSTNAGLKILESI